MPDRAAANAIVRSRIAAWMSRQQEEQRLRKAADSAIAWSHWATYDSTASEKAPGVFPAPWWKPGKGREEVKR